MHRHQYKLRSRTGIKALPTELLHKVHRLLPLPDLKSAGLVDKKWNSVCENPSLWSQAKVTVRSTEDIAKLSVGRLARLEEIWIAPNANWGNADWELFFQNIEKREAMKYIWGLVFRDFSVDPGLLARALNRVEKVSLWRCQLTPQQITPLFNHLAMGDSKIKKMCLFGLDLNGVDSGLLARGLNGLEDVELYQSWDGAYPLQITSFFNHLARRDSKIKKLMMDWYDLSVVPTDDLSIAVSRVEDVVLSNTRLTTEQLTSLLRHIVDNETKVKRLALDYNANHQPAVEENLLKSAKEKLSQSGGRFAYR